MIHNHIYFLQFTSIKDQGTRIIIYNLWEGDQGGLELDFIADLYVSFFFFKKKVFNLCYTS